MEKAKPFIKWVGGKRQLLPKILELVPKNINTYYEPFNGGGAVYFNIEAKKYNISDINNELVNLYDNIKNNSTKLFKELKKIQDLYDNLRTDNKDSDLEKMAEFYYKMRNIDREEEYKKWSSERKAARFIFLNKTAFNGLYRVNKKGQHNVPFGKYYKPTIFDKENLVQCNLRLNNNTEISINSFEHVLDKAKKGDFVYFDPPYVPLNKTSNFTSYAKESFDKEMQIKLKEICDKLTEKGVNWMLSNSSADFVLDLYRDYNINLVDASRNINSKGDKRGTVKEVLVTNY